MKRILLAVLLTAGFPSLAAPPQPAPPSPVIATPQDLAYPGMLKLVVDATDLDRRIFRVNETVPVASPGPLTLLFPKWLPGNHSATGQLDKFAGLIISANGQRLDWTRDPVEVAAFHIDVPPGVKALDLEFEFLSATETEQGRVVVTPEMIDVQWNNMLLYPAGYFSRQIRIEPSVRLPQGWTLASALETAAAGEGLTVFKPVSLETLVDSPIFAGRWVKKLELDTSGRSRVTLNVFADDPALLQISQRQVEAHRALVTQADLLFGVRHFDHYDFMLALSDKLGNIGLEHHRSSEDGTSPGYFVNWDLTSPHHTLLPHEYTHSWNGKFRRPADLWTANFNTPMRDSLLWVYEGQTQYWGFVLAARSGLLSKQDSLDALAATAAIYDIRSGRAWKSLAETTNDPVVAMRRPIPWTSWQRSEDYYSEGQLIWLDADTLIREASGGKKSLDDVTKAFFGGREGDWSVSTYDFDEVVAAMNAVAPYDWAGFFKARLTSHGPGAPLEGLARSGYRLVFTETPTEWFRNTELRRKASDLTYSLGLTLDKDGAITGVQWDGPAFNAGLAQGVKVIAVNGLSYDVNRLTEAVTAAKGVGPTVELLTKSGDRYRTVKVPYNGGLRYPRLERVVGTPDRLGEIFAARR